MIKPKILFISRAYPPTLGGIENQNFGLAESLGKITAVEIIANRKGKKNLPIFLPWIFLKSLFTFKNCEAALLGDGVLSPLGVWLKWFYPKKRVVSVVHGLDITFAEKKTILGKLYQMINIPALKKLDRLIMVGNETITQAQKFGIPREKCIFIPNGIYPEKLKKRVTRTDLEKILHTNLEGKKVIFRAGRFTRHKGLEWFIRHVFPLLPQNYFLVAAGGAIASATAGDENYYPLCEKAVRELDFSKRTRLIVNIPQADLETIFNACDLYVSPNIPIPGSIEGFGITAIEAAACGRVVLASDLEGLKDAIKDGQNGFLLEPENAPVWAAKIKEVLEKNGWREEFGKKAALFVRENYVWEKISRRYLEEISRVVEK